MEFVELVYLAIMFSILAAAYISEYHINARIWIWNSSSFQRATKCHSERVINSTAYSGSNYSVRRLYKLLFSSSVFNLSSTAHFSSILLLFCTLARKCKWRRRENQLSHFCPLDVGKPSWGRGLGLSVKINVFNYLWVYNCPYHGGSKELLTPRGEKDSESHTHLP